MGAQSLAALKATNKDFNNVLDSFINIVDGDAWVDFNSGYLGNLTGTGLSGIIDAQEIAGLAHISSADADDALATTLVTNAVNFMNSAHASAAGAIFLPQATRGHHLALIYTQSPDGHASAHAIHTEAGTNVSAGDVFAKQVIAGNCNNGATATSVVTAGTAAAPTSQILTYTAAAAATNSLGAGSIIQFYCPKDGQWMVRASMVPQGTGATGAYTVAN